MATNCLLPQKHQNNPDSGDDQASNSEAWVTKGFLHHQHDAEERKRMTHKRKRERNPPLHFRRIREENMPVTSLPLIFYVSYEESESDCEKVCVREATRSNTGRRSSDARTGSCHG